MDLSRYVLAALALVLFTCGSALPGLTSRDDRAANTPIAPIVQASALWTDLVPPIVSSFSSGPAVPDADIFDQAPPGYVYWKTVTAKVTAYEPSYRCCGKFADGKTATLTNAWKLVGVAVDPEAIPYGTMAWVPGIGMRVADDTGIAMKRSWRQEGVFHIDVRLKYFYQARNWGVKVLQVPLFRKLD